VEQAGSVDGGSDFVSRYSIWIPATAPVVLIQIFAVLVGDVRPVADGISNSTPNPSSRIILHKTH
jgi:hypothetical protein